MPMWVIALKICSTFLGPEGGPNTTVCHWELSPKYIYFEEGACEAFRWRIDFGPNVVETACKLVDSDES